MPSPVRFAEVLKLLNSGGFYLHHVTGSHHVFKHADGRAYSVPVHGGKVKPIYVKQIQKILG